MKISLNGNRSFNVTGLTEQEMKFIQDTFTYTVDERKYDYKKKVWDFHAIKVPVKCYTQITIDSVEFPMGFIFVFINLMHTRIAPDNLQNIISQFKNTEFKIENYYNLEDRGDTYSNLDTLLKTKRGVLQIPTGSGKTEMITTIVRNILDHDERVLVISETTPVLDEIRDRLKLSGLEVPVYFDKSSKVNIIKPTGFCRNGLYNETSIEEYFSKVKFIIADEVETVNTPSFEKLFLNMPEVDYMWGFSASANKAASTDIPKDITIKDKMNAHIFKVVKYFGFTAVNARPSGLDIQVITYTPNIRIHPDIKERNALIRKTFESLQVKYVINDILNRGISLFIPVNSKGAFYSILEDPMLNQRKIIMISGDGYILYEAGNQPIKLKLEELKEKVRTKEVRLVLGTASSYRGIDFHGLDSILLSFDSQSAIMRQVIGRITRQDKFIVFLMRTPQKIPFLTSSYWSNYKEIKDYYSKCRLRFQYVDGFRL